MPKAELQAYIDRAIAKNLVDQQVRAVDVGRMNVGVAVVHRGKLASPAPNSVAEHHQVRLDPDKIVPLKDETASKADLARK